ncbi:MAG: hypothetical protein RRZ83_06390 [Alistipes sp.]
MKKLLYLLAVVCISCFVACSDDDPEPDKTATYVLTANKTTVAVNEEIIFTVTTNTGEDITSKCSFCDNNMCHPSNKVRYSEAGTYTMEAHYMNGDPAFPAGIPVPNKVPITVK